MLTYISYQNQEAQLMLTNPRNHDVRYIFSRHCDFVMSSAITEKLIAHQELLFEVQRVTSLPQPRLSGLIQFTTDSVMRVYW